jgi:thiol-disulfide isomerase/thioredoxin
MGNMKGKPKVKKGRAAILIGVFSAMVAAPVLLFGALAGGGNVVEEFRAALVGRPSLIIFHSQSCPVCEQDQPYIQAMYDELGDQIRFVPVDIGTPEGKRIAQAYGVRGVPTYVFTDGEGIERNRVVGSIAQVLNQEGEQ